MTRLLIYSDRAGIYGAEQWTHRLCLAMQRAGHEVKLAQPPAKHALVGEREAAGIRHCWFDTDDFYEQGPGARALNDSTEPERVLKACAPGLVLFADSCPVANLPAKRVAAAGGIPYLAVVHCVTATWADQFAAHLPALAQAYRDAREVVTVSRENLDLLRAHFGLEPGKGRFIANGRPEAYFAPRGAESRQRLRAELDIPADAIVCLTIGRFERVKGFQYLLTTVHQLSARCQGTEIYFVWVGNGTLEPRMRQIVSALQARNRVRILGPRDDVPGLLDAADIFVLPSRFEGMPLVVIEAMAKGLPVVATAVSGTPEALGDTGCLLSDPASGADIAAQLTQAICELARDPVRRAKLGHAAHARARAMFHEDRMIGQYLDLVEREAAA